MFGFRLGKQLGQLTVRKMVNMYCAQETETQQVAIKKSKY